ncbi:MAG: hypothetical protein PHQ27_04245 [Victivallales bacterium]|nr:hypothetical protein [Victivallales bacterium]
MKYDYLLILIGGIIYYISSLSQTAIPASRELKLKIGGHVLFIFVLSACAVMSYIWGWLLLVALAPFYLYWATVRIKIAADGFIYRSLISEQRIAYWRVYKIIRYRGSDGGVIFYDDRKKVRVPLLLSGSGEFLDLVGERNSSIEITDRW